MSRLKFFKRGPFIAVTAGVVALLAAGVGMGLADAATTSTTLGDNTSHIYTCNHSAPLTVTNQSASSISFNCGARPTGTTTTTTHPTTTTTTQPTTTTTQPTTTTTQPTTTTTQPTTTTTQPGSPQCVTGDQASLNGHGGQGSTAFNDPTDINNSNGFNTYVENNVWGDVDINNNIKLCGTSPSNFNVTVGAGDAGDNNGTTQAYPNVQQLYDNWGPNTDQPTPIAQAGAPVVTSTFNTTDGAKTSTNQWESAYDIWSSGWDNDIMVWEDTTPARLADNGAVVVNSNVVIDGTSYTLLQNGGCTPLSCLAVNKGDGPQPEMMFVNNNINTTSGSINVDSFMKYLETNAGMSATNALTQVDFGWEICDTDGVNQTFTVNAYTLTRTPVEPS